MRRRWEAGFRAVALTVAAGWWLAAATVPVSAREVQVPTKPDSGITAHVVLPFNEPPAYGYLPVRVTIGNRTASDLTWELRATGTFDTYGLGRQVMISNTALPVGAGESRTFELLVPLPERSRSGHATTRTVLHLNGPAIEAGYSETVASEYTSNNKTPFCLVGEDIALAAWKTIVQRTEDLHGLDFDGCRVEGPELPTQWRAYLGVSHVFLSAPMWQALRPEQRAALDEWVAFGGEVFICTLDGSLPSPRDLGLDAAPPEGPTPDLMDIRYGVGRTVILPWSPDPAAVDTLVGYLAAPGTWDPGDMQSDFAYFWGLGREMPPLNNYNSLVLLFLVAFAITVGPLNLFVFARGRHRQRLFWTTPAISLGASLLLWLCISLGEGFGGTGLRMVVQVLRPRQPQMMVYQEQIARTASLWKAGFTAPVPYAIQPVIPERGKSMPARSALPSGKTMAPKRTPLGRPGGLFSSQTFAVDNGNAYSGDWFTSRNIQAQWLQTLEPTRAGLRLLDPGEENGPRVVSQFAGVLDVVYYIDADGRHWRGKALAPGVPAMLRPASGEDYDTFLDEMQELAGGRVNPVLNRMAGLRGHFYALVRESPEGALPTNAHISWKPGPVLTIGAVATGPEGAAP